MKGKGTFGQVVMCECKKTKEKVAIKVIKNKKAFTIQGIVEIKVLDIVSIEFWPLKLNRIQYDPGKEPPVVKMLDYFMFRRHLCIVFELLQSSLLDLIRENEFRGITINAIRLIAS